MAKEGWQVLDEEESRVMKRTSSKYKRELNLIVDLLDAYVGAFGLIGSLPEDNDLRLAWLLLVTRSFNSMRCAYDLLRRGYYSQALSLLRSVDEDWLICKDCEKHQPTVDALLHEKGELGKGDLTYGKMAEREGIKQEWDQGYGHLSKFAHGRPLALDVLIDPGSHEVRLGAHYDRVLLTYCCEVLIRAALRMTKYLVSVLGSRAELWMKETEAIVKEARVWLAELDQRYLCKDAT